jgi:hypothetical protein
MKYAGSGWGPATAATPPPGYAARVAGGVFLPVFTVISATLFAVVAVALAVTWWAPEITVFGISPHDSWFMSTGVPRWVAMVAILIAYAIVALPNAAARRATLYYANGGRAHGWANAWSGLLWIGLVLVLLAIAWAYLPQLHFLLQHHGWHHHRAVIDL